MNNGYTNSRFDKKLGITPIRATLEDNSYSPTRSLFGLSVTHSTSLVRYTTVLMEGDVEIKILSLLVQLLQMDKETVTDTKEEPSISKEIRSTGKVDKGTQVSMPLVLNLELPRLSHFPITLKPSIVLDDH